ncbi:MAG TPA: M3 family metallopeptidase, partial [Casimicrobiaceae bacterium]|nr:M3 family metallopeptidase [Casimicrobiaceae bacterium]
MIDNPLLDFSDLPRFGEIRAEHIVPAIETLLADARAVVERIAEDTLPASWDNVVAPAEAAFDHLDRAWGAVRHLNAVVNTPAIRDAYNAALPAVTAFHADMAQDPRTYARFRALADAPSFADLDDAQRKVVDNALRDFRLGGADLNNADKARFKAVQEELAALSARFDDNVLDSENAWTHYVDDAASLQGVPDDVIATARAAAQAAGRDGYQLTLRYPCYMPVMQYAEDRQLRAIMHRAAATLASDLGASAEWDNTPVIARILALRRDEAELLGYANYAELSLVPKMARHPDDVLEFLRDLSRRTRLFAERDYAELVNFARDRLAIDDVDAWDLQYAAEKLKAERFSFSEQEVRQYFPEHRVLAGLFRVVETIYGVRVEPGTATAWHPSVRFFEIFDTHGALIGQFYLDLYAREGKQSGAWMDDAINRRHAHDRLQHPVAYLTCNFSGPVGDKPAYFTHCEVTTLFHEFGHGLHQLLTRIDVAGVSGLQGVEWDAVELPSQFMENFCWEWDVLSQMTAHVDTDAPLPRALFERMLSARNFGSGMAMARQLELALFDMLLHSAYAPGEAGQFATPQAVLDAVRREVAVVPRPAYDRFMHGFGHIFAGGYAAGYYSYKWAEVLSADAFSLFEERGVMSPEIGARFRDEVLARGGSRPALESFVAFRGRAPQLDALLRHNGMV